MTDANLFYNLCHAICRSYGTDNYVMLILSNRFRFNGKCLATGLIFGLLYFFQFLLQLQLFLFLDTIIYSSYSKFLCYFSVILQFAHISTWTLSH